MKNYKAKTEVVTKPIHASVLATPSGQRSVPPSQIKDIEKLIDDNQIVQDGE